MAIQGIKGLEAQNIIIHGFVNFLNITQNNEKDLLYRKAYVLLTRARENLYLDFSAKAKAYSKKEVQEILDIIEGFTEKIKTQKTTTKLESKNTSNNLSLAKIRPILSDTKIVRNSLLLLVKSLLLLQSYSTSKLFTNPSMHL